MFHWRLLGSILFLWLTLCFRSSYLSFADQRRSRKLLAVDRLLFEALLSLCRMSIVYDNMVFPSHIASLQLSAIPQSLQPDVVFEYLHIENKFNNLFGSRKKDTAKFRSLLRFWLIDDGLSVTSSHLRKVVQLCCSGVLTNLKIGDWGDQIAGVSPLKNFMNVWKTLRSSSTTILDEFANLQNISVVSRSLASMGKINNFRILKWNRGKYCDSYGLWFLSFSGSRLRSGKEQKRKSDPEKGVLFWIVKFLYELINNTVFNKKRFRTKAVP